MVVIAINTRGLLGGEGRLNPFDQRFAEFVPRKQTAVKFLGNLPRGLSVATVLADKSATFVMFGMK